METNQQDDILPSLSYLCREKDYNVYFSKYLKSTVLTTQEREEAISILARLLFKSECTNDILKYFSKYILQFLSLVVSLDENYDLNYNIHVQNCVVLSILASKHPDAYRFMLKYFDKYPSPFNKQYFTLKTEAVPAKKKKSNSPNVVNELDIAESSYNILRTSAETFRIKWNWSEFIATFYKNSNNWVKWYCCHCIAIISGMHEKQLRNLLLKNFTEEKINEMFIEHDKKYVETLDLHINENKNVDVSSVDTKLCSKVVSVSGVLLPVFKKPKGAKSLVEVRSTRVNLRNVALGVASNRAICLQGPVGSSKTALVEYLAAITGREIGESFIKVQLGDQTDSKMLLGTYRCTDIPGEFVWQLGVLTQAVIEGSWLLLEDIDSASMDIATVITSLLENGYLTVPGYRDTVPITPGFQLFVTQRLLPSISGYHRKHTNVNSLLEKYLMQVNIEPLTQDELVEVIKTLFPALSTIATRIVDVFMLFSVGHDVKDELNIPTTGRFTSTRDLFKWCERAVVDFDVTSPNSALKVLQDAIDTFCCSLPKEEDRLRLATAICARLGVIETKAEYFCRSYKPSVSLTATSLIVGRDKILRDSEVLLRRSHNKFSFTRNSSCLLERIICCINLIEPVLLVGETGTGKTSSIQYLAETVGQKLIVINMNQQSDSADLLGGYKPVDMKIIIAPVKLEFELLFRSYFSIQHNQEFLKHIANCFNAQKWSVLVNVMKHSQKAAMQRLSSNKEKTEEYDRYLRSWTELGVKLNKLSIQIKQQNTLAFAFIEGSLVKAIENGHWVLLDEINLANAETLECLSGLLEGSNRSLTLLEKGDKKPVTRHKNFTLFACMNPSTDVGKKDLPTGLRNRFTEFFIEELTEKNDLLLLVNTYLKDLGNKQSKIESIVKFYLNIRKEAMNNLCDGSGHAPHYSLRTLCRALMIAAKNNCGTVDRNLYEAFCLSFLTQLDTNSYKTVEQMIAKSVIGNAKEVKSILNQPIPEPKSDKRNSHVQFEGYWVTCGGLTPETPNEYILTQSVRKNLKDLVRVVAIGKLPVLLQGDTSVGKTSLIMYLAKSSGNKCVRINNHEHTDLQEYIGSYVSDATGKLVFREGVLVEAMRKGHWIILDELNLAPTDVLEALNRVLDDNRELFIPETQETVKAHQNFMLFATQNPPGAYGGRKMLSRAFRNRFVELHFNEIPSEELEIILHKRCEIPPSYCKKMIAVMTDLQMRRRGSAAFAGKQGFITLRDLFRWGERYRLAPNVSKLYDWDQHIVDEGYLVLAGRVRKSEERNEIAEVLHKHFKRSVNVENLFSLHEKTSPVTRDILEKIYSKRDLYKNIVWTLNTRQLAVLVAKAKEFNEPVLLVGETGGGKTTICRVIAENNGQELITVNCHMHTESSDFIGGLRPVRERNEENKNKLFEWMDGPLLKAMRSGQVFLADEISLADDSVLERLNSLLEPERTLLLVEKGIDLSYTDSDTIKADEKFHFIGTMNPGGDFGKKELSPALRNRFTEIWCETCTDRNDLIDIIEHNLNFGLSFGNQQDGTSGVGRCIMDFIEWFRNNEIGKRFTISIRDILTWVNFINVCLNKIEVPEAYVHGACLTFLDSFGSGVTGMENVQILKQLKNECIDFMTNQVSSNGYNPEGVNFNTTSVQEDEICFGIKPFFVEKGNYEITKDCFTFNAPTTRFNALRVLRGLQLNKAILLEGSPGVGKTSLVSALAKATSHKLLRINLSDQTDVSDLFGADLPVEGGKGGEFAWRDGPFLQALKNGDWIVLDELNLASQSVLEGLNACLDHRGEIYIPELGKTFYVKPNTRLFACQNPLRQGGSRRGLPKSFLNRFTQVYIDSLTTNDLSIILSTQFPMIPENIRRNMIKFNDEIVKQTETYVFGYKGSPWEFNLRDLIRWCEVMLYQNKETEFHPESSVTLIYGDRMRTKSDKERINHIFQEIFNKNISGDAPLPYVTMDRIYLGDVEMLKSKSDVNLHVLNQEPSGLLLRTQYHVLRSLTYCVNLNWMAILVGSSACGKSNVVRTLAQLAGSELRTLPVNSGMDTMDILGGFEQVDYNRNLEEISSKIERLVLCTVQEYLLRERSGKAKELLVQWELFKNVDENHGGTMAEEMKRFVIRLNKLKDVLNSLRTFEVLNVELLDQLEELLEKLQENVENEGQLNAGGKFEWIDSILIKCLQDGCWLLIDNVNLCSPAVLDRLNALLEPNGLLTINERGVCENGDMITIKPHPNFRLFLTMDPKNGEISRAMRNRGVEIYLLNDIESEVRNDFDLKAIIGQNGVNIESLQDALIKIHDYISENVLGEKPTISSIIQSSFLISQQILRGFNIIEVFTSTILDVYVKSRYAHDFKFDKPEDQIIEYVKTVIRIKQDATNHDCTLKTKNLQFNHDLELIKQQTVLLKPDVNYLLATYTVTSIKNIDLRRLYIKSNFDCEKFGNDLYVTIKEFVNNSFNLEFPLDEKWLPGTMIQHPNSNRLILLLYFVANKIVHNKKRSNIAGRKLTKFSIMEYSQQVMEKKISQSINNTLITKYYSIIKEFDEFFEKLLKNVDINLTNEEIVNCFVILNWRFVLEELGETVIYDKTNKNINVDNILSELIVRYKWFLKATVSYFMKFSDEKLSKKLINVLNSVNESIQSDLSHFKKIAKRYMKNIIRPTPFTNKKQIENHSYYLSILSECSINIDKNDDLQKRVSFVINETEKWNEILKLRSDNFDDSNQLKSLYETITLYKPEIVTATQVQRLPVDDLMALYLMMNIRTRLIYDNTIDDENIQTVSKISTVPLQLQSLLHVYIKNHDKKLLHEILTSITTYYKTAPATSPLKFIQWNKINDEDFTNKKLLLYSPVLSFAITNLYTSSNLRDLCVVTDLGSYKTNQDQLRYLNDLLWLNSSAISSESFDFAKNDLKYAVKSFKLFVETLAKTLNVEESETLCGRVYAIIEKINTMFVDQIDSKEMLSNKDNFVKYLEQITEELLQIGRVKDDVKLLFHVANIYCLLNYCKAILNTQLQVIDPLQKVILRKKYCGEERNICEGMKGAYEKMNEIYSPTEKTLHPYCKIMGIKIKQYEQKEAELSTLVATRPENLFYSTLVKDVTHNFGTLLSNEYFSNLYTKIYNKIKYLMDAIDNNQTVNLHDYSHLLREIDSWLNSQENAFSKISIYRVGYPDIVEPILTNISEMSYGFKLLNTVLKKSMLKYEYNDYDLNVYMTNLIKFPSIHEECASELGVMEACTGKKYLGLVTRILESGIEEERIRLLKSGLQELYNVFVVGLTDRNDLCHHLFFLINVFVSAWNKQEMERQKKAEEEKSLFKTKKCENLSDEEQAEREIRELFKNYHVEDFSDFNESVHENGTTESSDEFVGAITDDDIRYVYQIHYDLMFYFTKNEWLSPKKCTLEPNFIEPFVQRCKTYNRTVNKIVDALDYKIDKSLISSLNLLVSYSKNLASDEKTFESKKGSFDYYHDSKIEEVKTCFHILKALEKRIQELLIEWPSHPTLTSIKLLLERIFAFAITSPVARFLTGLEILLSKCHEWEENAHSGVSLSEYTQNLTLQVINWRKLELACWKDSLNKAFERVRNSVSKWWLHLYSTVHQFLYEDNNEITSQKIIKALEEFIENSSLGEFESRLNLLFVFHCHILHLPISSKTQILISVLWNLYRYYQQFLENVNNKIKTLRTPVEKKLKDFIKIARWNDINYWSVKQTVEKTHRSLHKFIKEFENILKETVRPCLVYNMSESDENVGIWDRPQRHIPSQYHYNLDVDVYMAKHTSVPDNTKYFNKSRVLCKNIISTTPYPDLIKNIDTFVTEVIENANRLKNLEVNTELPKPKQKSQAKSILQQKRKALADLFKTLNDFGISYRTGIIESKLRDDSNIHLLKPIDLQASFECFNKTATFKQLLNIWDGCETYFLRTISRQAAMESALRQPSPDLGLQNIERCKGFSMHLFILQQEQKAKLIETTRYLLYLRHYISEFENGESTPVDSKTIRNLNSLLMQTLIIMQQYQIILKSCPENDFSEVITVPLLDAPANIKYKNELNWNSAYAEIKNVAMITQKLKSHLDKLYHKLPSYETFLNEPNYFLFDKNVVQKDLVLIKQGVVRLHESFGDNPVSDSLKWLLKRLDMATESLTSEYSPESDETNLVDFNARIDKLTENILLVIQNMYKKYNETKETAETDENDYHENHLRIAIIENLLQDISVLEMKKIFRNIIKIMNCINKMGIKDINNCRLRLRNCVPLLEQLSLMYEYFVTQQVAAYRVTSKMNSVLLSIFTELVTKGFCIPPEFSEELQKEGQTKLMGGTGLGDGEGEKDVSDKIENEDQLDDAQPANQEKKKDEDKDCKEEEKGIEMSEDFDSKLQDVDKPEDENESNSDDSDAEKQMGDTEQNSDRLDKQIWGSDEENEDVDEENKNEKEERGDGGEVEDKQMAAKEDDTKANEENENDDKSKDKRKEQEKDINEMEEKEYDDEQVDPYHGNQPPMPEPEAMDLPDDLQLDDGEEKEETPEENPFDIDTMKEQVPPPLEDKEEEKESDNKEPEKDQMNDSSDEEELDELKLSVDDENDEKPEENPENKNSDNLEKKPEDAEEESKDDAENSSALDNQTSEENKVQPMEVDNIDKSANVETNPNQNQNNNQSNQASQEESIEKDGVGQTQMEVSETGHKGQANAKTDSLNSQNEKEPLEKRQRPGESDINRSLGEMSEPVRKKLKTINIHEREEEESNTNDERVEMDKDAETYQHIKEARKSDAQVLDAATKEQAEHKMTFFDNKTVRDVLFRI